MDMRIIDPKKTPTRDFHQFLLGSVAPRPIAFASTLDENGVPNIAPYSFFNAFSSNPPILVFSSNRRVRDNTTKDTLHNVMTTKEVVINVVNYSIVRQMALAAVEFPKDVSEFTKTGLTPVASDLVKPFRIKESPAQMECKVKEIVTLGEHGGAGHLIICEVVRLHVAEDVIDERGRIDPHKIDLMGRMGRSYYVRCSGAAVKTLIQPVAPVTIGFDALPASVRNSPILTGNDLGFLGGLVEMPTSDSARELSDHPGIQALMKSPNPLEAMHDFAKQILDFDGDREKAMKVLLLADGLA